MISLSPVVLAPSAGFLTGFGLILAIGAQNAFVLRQGLLRQHVLLVVMICAISDALLIAAGILGARSLVEAYPEFVTWMRWGGAAFLIVYGTLALSRAFKRGQGLEAAQSTTQGAAGIALTALALTWLNPHVYLDTVALLGSISTEFAPYERLFGFGAIASSFVFFFSLGFGARLLAPIFARPRAWQFLDGGIALVMFAIAAKLIWSI